MRKGEGLGDSYNFSNSLITCSTEPGKADAPAATPPAGLHAGAAPGPGSAGAAGAVRGFCGV